MTHPVRDVLVVVPGILGSCLERNGEPIWGTAKSTARALLNPEAALALHGDGFAPEQDVRAVGLIGRVAQFPGLSKIDAYDGLTDSLRRGLKLDQTNFVIFPYDWRLSCSVNARLLEKRICPVLKARRRRYPDARFIFVCHSMGGLVVQHFTDVLGAAADTKEVITLGTPFRGAVKALGVLSLGWPIWLPGVRSRFQRLARTLPSVYELLPRYRAVVEGSERRTIAPRDLPATERGELFERAYEFHKALDVPEPRPYGRMVVVGSLQLTPQFAQVEGGEVRILKRWEHDGAVLDERGDGTVPRQSVTPPEWGDDSHTVPVPNSHIALPTAAAVFRVLLNVLTATPRAEQAEARAKLALEVPDLLPAGEPLEIGCEVAEGDPEVPLLIRLEALGGRGWTDRQSPKLRNGALGASFSGLAPGDYRVTVEPGALMPDVPAVWDLVTVVDPSLDMTVVD